MATIRDSTYNAPTAFAISLDSLASSTGGTGRQAAEIDNTATRFARAQISTQIKLGTSPSANGAIYVYIIRNNNAATPIRDDNAGAVDSSINVVNAQLIGVLSTGPAPSTGLTLYDNFIVYDLGPKWTIAIVNASGSSLDSNNANHVVTYAGITDDIA